MASGIKAQDKFPENVTFSYIPYDEKTSDEAACGRPIEYKTSKEFAGKKVVLVSVPGAFTPTCSAQHVPGILKKIDEFKAAGVDQIAVIAYNDPFVMNAWRRENGVKNDYVLFMTDPGAAFASSIGWTKGERTGRFAIVIDDNKVIYAENEPGSELTVSSAESVLEFLQKS